ncbi:hypothetical protein E1B28_007566 [Marasmius oreades]|uniref:Glucose-methanol-choline oxidoreductase N-terminal domain-containing protein n=1 Tax=Marasmius oreades TaxID=181124 RepID=A0A9P7UV20_9AGAR|nr:uncharacterized protein E1B28_007566 [Marasmius oreades]KAG7093931.1 hypothetical protein E1B28_007566 [Marasmius oreades]
MWPFEDSVPEITAQDAVKRQDYDYIIVGGGTAGCCLASRLSEDPSVTVLIIELGNVADSWASKVPVISANPHRSGSQAARWKALPLSNVDSRVLDVVRGEALGGSSRVNAMVYTRGAPGDYNRWKEMGHPSWGYDQLEPYFVKSEKTLSQPPSSFRGGQGPWENRTFKDLPYRILHHVASATSSLGIPGVADINSPHAPAVGYATLDVATDRKMYRASTYRAFLPPSLTQERKSRLFICTNSQATLIRFSSSTSGRPKAEGVHFQDVKSDSDATQSYFVKARKEIVLCCGAVGSPHLLQLSGVGPKAHLISKGIKVVRDMPGVGTNLQDHVGLPVMYEIPLNDSLHVLERSTWVALTELLKYVVTGRGIFSLPFMQTSLFVPSQLLDENSCVVHTDKTKLDSSLPANTPDIEIMPIAFRCSDDDVVTKEGIFSFLTAHIRPKSFGSVRLASAYPLDRPAVDLGFLSNPEDYLVLRKCVRLALRLAEQVRSQGYPLKDLQVPETENDADIDRFIRKNLRTSYHYSSTCRMGAEHEVDRPGVVDDELRVHGIDALRVCDASVFPEIIAAHTMAPTVVVAEKCADMMKAAAVGKKI